MAIPADYRRLSVDDNGKVFGVDLEEVVWFKADNWDGYNADSFDCDSSIQTWNETNYPEGEILEVYYYGDYNTTDYFFSVADYSYVTDETSTFLSGTLSNISLVTGLGYAVYAYVKDKALLTQPLTYKYNTQTLKTEEVAEIPTLPTPTLTDAEFVGWYYEDTYENQVEVGTVLTGPSTIYAKFIKKEWDKIYAKPTQGIPQSDLSQEVQEKLTPEMRVITDITKINNSYTENTAMVTLASAMTVGDILVIDIFTSNSVDPTSSGVRTVKKIAMNDVICSFHSSDNKYYIGTVHPSNSDWSGWEQLGSGSGSGSGSSIYDKVIRTQAEFDALISSDTWLGAKSVCFVGDGGTLEFTSDRGITIPTSVYNIKGLNNAKIKALYLTYGSSAYGTIGQRSISGLHISDGTANSLGFISCFNLTNCSGDGRIVFSNCTNLVNCRGSQKNDTMEETYIFDSCNNLINCTSYVSSENTGDSAGFGNCSNLSNCESKGSTTFGFFTCANLSNCKGTTGGAMIHVDSETVHNDDYENIGPV